MRVRGLKHIDWDNFGAEYEVAPRAGAWVETIVRLIPTFTQARRTPCGCVG